MTSYSLASPGISLESLAKRVGRFMGGVFGEDSDEEGEASNCGVKLLYPVNEH